MSRRYQNMTREAITMFCYESFRFFLFSRYDDVIVYDSDAALLRNITFNAPGFFSSFSLPHLRAFVNFSSTPLAKTFSYGTVIHSIIVSLKKYTDLLFLMISNDGMTKSCSWMVSVSLPITGYLYP